MNVVGVDVGGTKIAAGVVTPEGELLNEARCTTADTPEKLLGDIERVIGEVRDGFDAEAVCLAVPGFVLTRENKVVYSPNLRAIEGIPLKEELGPKIGLPLTIENDGNAAAWGEFRFGAGREVDHLIFITLGTGVGAGVISHGALMRGAQGSGGELGHVTVHATGPRCACGNRGCLEALVSGSAIGRRAREAAVEWPDSALGRIASERELLGEDVTKLGEEGDKGALSVLDEAGAWLGIGIAGFVNIFNPEVVAVGGGAAKAGDLILEPARRELHLRARSPSRDLAQIRAATLGENSGVLGAAALARHASSGDYVLEA